jgi:hypothetical protein
MTSDRFGFVRRAALLNLGAEPVEVDLLDGIQNLLPHGLTRRFQMEYSTLADGYKENELDPETGLGLFKLSSVPADRPEPNEALRVTTVWSEGIQSARRLLCSAQLDRFRRGERWTRKRSSAAAAARISSTPSWRFPQAAAKSGASWRRSIRTRPSVAALVSLLKSGGDLRAQLDEDVERGTRNLVRIVAAADGLQLHRRRPQR